MKLIFFRGRLGRFLLIILSLVILTLAIFFLASVFMAHDPDGHLVRNWLHENRWGLFVWRLVIYAGIVGSWFLKVRAQLLQRWPAVRQRLPRTELLVLLFLLTTEWVAWHNVA